MNLEPIRRFHWISRNELRIHRHDITLIALGLTIGLVTCWAQR